MEEQLRLLARLVAQARSLIAFTGAGISTDFGELSRVESGLPDFQSPGGLWSRHHPVSFPDFLASAEARHQYWRFYQDFYPPFRACPPRPCPGWLWTPGPGRTGSFRPG